MKRFRCPTCGKSVSAIGSSVTCIGGEQKPPPAVSTLHPRTEMKEVAHA